jgi:hypothetical protein
MNTADWTFNSGTFNSGIYAEWSWQTNPPEQPPLAGVREPRNPYPLAPAGSVSLELSDA